MPFLSFNFAISVGLALAIFYATPQRWRPGLLLGLSYLYSLTWSVFHTLLLFAVTTGVYFTAIWIESRRTEKGKRAGMAAGVMSLLVLLFAFKAGNWFLKEFHASPAVVILAPLGLSYYVFKMAGYLLDVYWETVPAQRNFVSVALYGSFFSQIVSGPIQRAESFFDQIKRIRNPDAGEFQIGLRRILFGLAKKILIADTLGVLVQNSHAHPSEFSPLELLVGAYCFSIQLYADFSGITDIAIGLGLLFGVRGPENFDLPYFASNMQLFWRKMHMSLTTWLTDYLFTPLRMSLRHWGTVGLCLAIFINTVAIGLWHGLALTFLTFGAIHGVYVIISALTIKRRNAYFQKHPGLARIRVFTAPLLTFHMLVFSHIFFRAESFGSAIEYINRLFAWGGGGIPPLRFDPSLVGVSVGGLTFCLIAYLISEGITWATRQQFWMDRLLVIPKLVRAVAYSVVVAVVLIQFRGAISFIYAAF